MLTTLFLVASFFNLYRLMCAQFSLFSVLLLLNLSTSLKFKLKRNSSSGTSSIKKIMLEGKIRNPDASVIKTEKQSRTETID